MSQDKIIIKGAREHNLKNISLEIPKNKLIVFTGLSGSGKSSLAFDTIYAEGQRRYVESLSSYARQFLGVMDKPDVDAIEGLSPAISIDQKAASHNPRSTVGTVTEIYDYLRLLFARVGHPHCPVCGREISHQSKDQIVAEIQKLGKAQKPAVRVLLLAPIIKDRKGEFKDLFKDVAKRGYRHLRVDGKIRSVDEDFVLIKTNKHSIEAVVDRLTLPADKTRLSDSVEQALKLGEGSAVVSEILDKSFDIPEFPENFIDHLFSEKFACPLDNISLPEIEPRSFSFNSPHGACPSCNGLGSLRKVDPDLVLNPNLTIAEGAILPWARLVQSDSWTWRVLEQVLKDNRIDINAPVRDLNEDTKNIILYGTKNQFYTVRGPNRFGKVVSWDTTFEGVITSIEQKYGQTESDYIRREVEKFMRIDICASCMGTRLKPEALSVTIDKKSVADIAKLAIKDSSTWVKKLAEAESLLSEREKIIAKPILKELILRVQFLIDVGLDYLTIDRTANTLAGGEAQRIRLASQIGSGLSGVLYVLDEPSIGLHQRDNERLIKTLKRLRDLQNTVIVVEHDRDMMLSADEIVDFGPAAGEHGGQIVSQGTYLHIMKDPKSLTGKYLSGKKKVVVDSSQFTVNGSSSNTVNNQPSTANSSLTLLGAAEHNLKNIDVQFPLGKFICVTGVSGSGKSTLIHDILYAALAREIYGSRPKPGEHKGILGAENLDKVILIDQSPIGRTPRSNPATYTGAFTYVRDLFAKTTDARIRGYKPGRFSFNVKGGRCEACEGEGQVKIEMQFLPDVYVDCEVCSGKRYNEEALEIHYNDKNISEILNMTVEVALKFFENIPPIKQKLETIYDVGLGYIRLGQPAPTLSGGEAQRVKLATELSKRATGKTLYILDEPTTGLHFADIERLLLILRRLVATGNTVIIIEHNLDVIRNTDWIIDLGPEGGDLGGKIVATGTPHEVAKIKFSYTGQFLAKEFLKS
ncbi:excinuclease ABC subunit A [Candidatus Curtissbacteria bacterium RIFCSPHIGHO2_01_FULL_41_11]|uniref:UvrABC system protein A n=1 Tax=Candidatus Curtissbacteria bacterium RIFCSPHIGHO2_01_FULL_41_11 TaxID=1797711 RepID=A0A1F5G685_9BACT|nr:MAG: excinuclease ABC subunit A [Candidatus Curtissbacteria bacterium RIFCSPHIGHO2_01_FULL_41_11]